MKFLLVNENIAVKKLFNISAKKANIELDIIPSFAQLRLQEDYSCVFVDDGVVDINMVQNLKNKMITTKFCLIISKNKAIEGVLSIFDIYIKKPFLPTDIYDVLKKEKYSEMKYGMDSYEDISSINVRVNSDSDEVATIDYDGIRAVDVSDINIGGVNDIDSFLQEDSKIDLGEFNDNDDEFISGMKDDKKEENNQYQSEYNFDDISLKPKESIAPLMMEEEFTPKRENTFSQMDDIPDTKTMGADPLLDSIPNMHMDHMDEMNLGELDSNVALEPSFSGDNDIDSNDAFEESFENQNEMPFRPMKKPDDDIDFASIFAMQDEFLQTQNNEKKPIIGGDIFSKKESNQKSNELNLNNKEIDSIPNENLDSNVSMDTMDEMNLEPAANSMDDNFMHRMNINDLSEIELENLDDETLLRLQEEEEFTPRMQEIPEYESQVFDEMQEMPKILNKNDIDEVNGLLQETKNIKSMERKEVKGVEWEENPSIVEKHKMLEKQKNENINEMHSIKKPLEEIEEPVQISANSNIGLDIIKTFSIDKLRELLSGAQITINITFPTKDK